MCQGITQGSVLWPLIFSLYINNLSRSLRHMLHHPVQLYYSFAVKDVLDAYLKINNDIAAVCALANENGLMLNAGKT